ncbi:MAG: CvpA family protein [Syntrophomonadaceae bacterium]|nr:CvpA family protein [Syntrophomonadaceae bacterium]
MIFNLLDYIILAVIVLSAMAGLYKGLVKAVGGIVSIVAGILVAARFYGTCLLYIEKSFGVISLLAAAIRNRVPLTALSLMPGFSTKVNLNQPFVDTAQWLANMLVLAVCFLLIFLVSSKLVNLCFDLVGSLFNRGIFSWVNRLLGMALIMAKNIIIMAVVLGLLYPSIELASRMGFHNALEASRYLQASLLVDNLLVLFNLLKVMLGISV